MEGTAHSNRPLVPLPAEPKPKPPRQQPGKRAKRAKTSPTEPPASIKVTNKQKTPIQFELVGLLAHGERFPDDIKKISVTLSVPTPDEECPIALEPIGTAKLMFLPDCPFIQDNPEYSKMTLPCGHSFSAMVLAYSWCKNNMLCPCCRQGVTCRANPSYLPAHFREQLRAQVASTTQVERIEEERESMAALLEMAPITTSFQALSEARHLEMIIDFSLRSANEPRTNGTGQLAMIVPLTTAQQNRGAAANLTAVFTPSERHMEVIRHTPDNIRSLCITTHMRIPGAGLVDIDTSGEIDFPALHPLPDTLQRTPLIVRRATGYRSMRRISQGDTAPTINDTLPIVPVSTFELTFGQRNGRVFLDGVAWVPDSSHVHVSLNRVQ
jgi:hypothetical protein